MTGNENSLFEVIALTFLITAKVSQKVEVYKRFYQRRKAGRVAGFTWCPDPFVHFGNFGNYPDFKVIFQCVTKTESSSIHALLFRARLGHQL